MGYSVVQCDVQCEVHVCMGEFQCVAAELTVLLTVLLTVALPGQLLIHQPLKY